VLETRGAGVWAALTRRGQDTRRRVGSAYDAGASHLRSNASRKLAACSRRSSVRRRRRHRPARPGERALSAGQQSCGPGLDLAVRIDPRDQRAALGQSRARRLSGVLPLLADARTRSRARVLARGAGLHPVLTLDRKMRKARRARALERRLRR